MYTTKIQFVELKTLTFVSERFAFKLKVIFEAVGCGGVVSDSKEGLNDKQNI